VILVIDNYDSFVHNLARYLREAGAETVIMRNDAASAEDILQIEHAGVVISPGPKSPSEAGVSLSLIGNLSRRTPLLGVCLGCQCLVEAFGGRTERAAEPLHGEASAVRHDGRGLFEGLPSPMQVGRYHSLIGVLPEEGPLEACAWSASGELMAVRHRLAPWCGVQFHPESLLTPYGRRMIERFVKQTRLAHES
jgi:anthranilate synthase/aminodeoxychorismate synthase-like glutamine amidotransferase